MADSFLPGALLGHVYTLENGVMVRLRLARSSDAAAVKALLERQAIDADDVQIARLVHFDPRQRYVLCATGLVGSTQTLLGIGSIRLDARPPAHPDFLAVDDGCGQVRQLLTSALVASARLHGDSRAA